MADGKDVVTDAQAKAVDATAKAAQQALTVVEKSGAYFAEVFGTLPHDVVGLLGDWVKVRRAENLSNIVRRAKERLEARGVKSAEPPSPSITLPLLVAAADESRDELQDIWARLMAAAADPKRQGSFRILFIDIAKQLDPLDALVMKTVAGKPPNMDGSRAVNWRDSVPGTIGILPDQFVVSCNNLGRSDLLDNPGSHTMHLSALGREFMRAIDD